MYGKVKLIYFRRSILAAVYSGMSVASLPIASPTGILSMANGSCLPDFSPECASKLREEWPLAAVVPGGNVQKRARDHCSMPSCSTKLPLGCVQSRLPSCKKCLVKGNSCKHPNRLAPSSGAGFVSLVDQGLGSAGSSARCAGPSGSRMIQLLIPVSAEEWD